MKINLYTLKGKVLPRGLYTDSLIMKEHLNGEKVQEVKQFESTIKY